MLFKQIIKRKLKISKTYITDKNVGLILDTDTYVENFLHLKTVRLEGRIYG